MKNPLDSLFKKENKGMDKGTKTLILAGVALVSAWFGGFLLTNVFSNITNLLTAKPLSFSLDPLFQLPSFLIGLVAVIVVYFVTRPKGAGKSVFRMKKGGDVDSVLENSRFMTDRERDKNFRRMEYKELGQETADGIPVYAVYDKGKLEVNLMKGVHALVIGSTGSGKTTTFINPMIQLIGASQGGSSMIITDPKGELFDLHSGFLKSRGYEVYVIDLRDTYSSSRWNPLEAIWNQYELYRNTGNEIRVHRDKPEEYPDLKWIGDAPEEGAIWAEWEGKAYSDLSHLQDEIAVKKQRIYDEMYEDLSDLVSGICPIQNEKDPLWEKGARSIIQAVCLAMLEDSDDPENRMTKEKYNFFNVSKILTNSADNYKVLKEYFQGRDNLSQAFSLSRQVLAAAEETLSSYMSITYDKLSIFNDRGICGLTSATDIRPESIAEKPTALFIKIPDEKDTRHSLASLFILSVYKGLIKVASAREDLALPRNVYYIMDEFGNMPKIEKFDKMITVGRSRKIWFSMVVQSYSQLENVYGKVAGDIVKSNCGMKMFIGSNDIETCKEFSELCGNKTVRTTSSSANVSAKDGDMNVSTQLQTRPLIYPSELQKLNNKTSTGNAIIVTFGNYPLKTKFTPSYKVPLYKTGPMSLDDIRAHVFHADEVYYDAEARNRRMVSQE